MRRSSAIAAVCAVATGHVGAGLEKGVSNLLPRHLLSRFLNAAQKPLDDALGKTATERPQKRPGM
jgi:hypothetical protein